MRSKRVGRFSRHMLQETRKICRYSVPLKKYLHRVRVRYRRYQARHPIWVLACRGPCRQPRTVSAGYGKVHCTCSGKVCSIGLVVCIKQENTQYYTCGRDGGCRARATGGLRRETQGEPEAQGGDGMHDGGGVSSANLTQRIRDKSYQVFAIERRRKPVGPHGSIKQRRGRRTPLSGFVAAEGRDRGRSQECRRLPEGHLSHRPRALSRHPCTPS